MKKIYLIGSLRNKEVPKLANKLRKLGFDVFDDWWAPGKNTDKEWKKYEIQRGRTYKEALKGYHAIDVFEFDHKHLLSCDIGILLLPCGKSGHMELGYLKGLKKKTYVLMNKKSLRWDIMYQLSDGVFDNLKDLIKELKK